MPWPRPTLKQIGTWLLFIVVLAVALAVALSVAMNSTADDLRQQVRVASGVPLEHPPTPPATWLSDRIVADLAPEDFAARFARADGLDHRADRIRELAGAMSLVGLVLMLVTATPDARSDAARDVSSPVASTKSNGTA
jgi:hypothetical protein